MDEAAGAADAGSYGLCLGVSKFVRLSSRWIAGVSKLGWSFQGDGKRQVRSFLTRISAEMGGGGMGGDTTAVRAGARGAERGMGSGLGRVKGRAP